jgi:hypothetical protein
MIGFLTIGNRVLFFSLALFGAAVLHRQTSPKLSRGKTFFGVHVEPGFEESEAGRTILRQFRLQIWSAGIAFGAASLLAPVAFAVLIVTLPAAMIGWAAFALAQRRVRRESKAMLAPTVRVASLAVEDERGGSWLAAVNWLAMLLPPLAPSATLLFFALHRDQVRPSTTFVVSFALILGLMCSINQWALVFRARSSDWATDPHASLKYRSYLGAMMALVFLFIGWQICAMSIIPFNTTVPWLKAVDIWKYFLVNFPLQAIWLVTVFRMRSWLTKHLATGSCDPMPDACWKWGYCYSNPDDSALVVPLRTGVGHSFNFAHTSVRIVVGIVAIMTIASFIQSFLTTLRIHRGFPL